MKTQEVLGTLVFKETQVVTVPERFVRFGMPGVWFLSHCPSAVMGSCLAGEDGFCPRNCRLLNL